jgi:hypothetical protein
VQPNDPPHRWLITLAPSADRQEIEAQLSAVGGWADPNRAPITFDTGEVVIEVAGPGDLPARFQGQPGVVGIHPSSDLTLY